MKQCLLNACKWTLTLVMSFCISLSLQAQNVSLSGKVTDANSGDALPGVSVMIEGTSSGTASDAEGNYALSVPANATLVFSFIGYANQSVAVNNRTTINVTLAEDLTQLDEIVVVGYGTQEKRDVTGAIASISETQIKEIPVSSSVKVLQGRVAGVDIQQNGGRPGEGVTVRIRGRRSIAAGNDPLYVVDGIPLTSGIDDINPQDIKSIEVLKDAAATSIYGSRGANGVILITTNRGKAGKTVVSYDGYHGITSAVTTVDMMDGKEFYDLKRESRRFDPNTGALSFDGQLPDDITVFEEVELESISQNYRTTDYQDLILNNGYQTSHQLSVSGGSEKTTFMVSAGIFDEQGIIKTQDYVRNTIRLNLDHKINDIFSFGTSTLVAYTEQNWASNPLGEALSNNPLGYPYEADGVTLRFLPTNDGIRTNPLSEVVEGAYVEERKFTRIFNSLFLEIRPLEGLTFRSTFGPDYRNRRMGLFQGSYTNARRGGPSRADAEFNTDFAYTLENLLTYNKTLTEGHELKVTFLQSIQKSVEEDYSVSVTNLPYESQLFYNIGSTADITGWSSRYEGWQMASFMGRVNYDINGKYLFQASMRADGSSRLAAGNLWDYFPGISAGWRIIEEAFMADQNMFSELKVRASYGKVGNTSIDPYQTLGRLRSTSYVFGSTPAFGFGLIEIPNTLLGWENTATTDIGVDFGVLDGRLSGTLDFYRAKTTDLLLPRQLPTTSGYTSVLQNVGVTRNTGLEIGLSAVPVDAASGFKWITDVNWYANKEEIVELYNGAVDDIGNRWFIGEPLRVFYDFRKVGIWQVSELDEAKKYGMLPGENKLEDVSNDDPTKPRFGDEERQILGSDVPKWSGGITNRFEYKGLDLMFFLFARWGHMVDSRFHDSYNTLAGRYNNLNVDYWTVDNPNGQYPRPNRAQESAKYASTMRYFDGSYLKLRNITLGYNVPSSIVSKFKLTSMRVYFSAQNPWFYSKYEVFDPEDNEEVSGNVPSTKVFLGGINLKF